ncbi:hypothetical protein [Methylobacterium sp. Leaf112]|uniref:hypothetical protein n=1 Tax=Methylobacterium sp. Leaf112 TaxID=1736258 RepID=UPI000A787FEC|nr:hypothetical protein [Methylobacterium sp. Leaf112]
MTPTIRLVCALLPLLSSGALAQDAGASILQGLQQQQFQGLDAAIGAQSVEDTARLPRGDAERPVRRAALPFTTSAELRAATIGRHIQALRATNPIAAVEVAREMAKHDYDAIFRSFLTQTDLRADDAGDVLTAFIVLQWMVANNVEVDPSPTALRAIRRRMVEPIAGKPPLSRPATRAAFAEQVKLRTVLHHAGWQAARRLGLVPDFLAGLSKDFIPVASLRSVAFTDEGLVQKGRRPGSAGPAPDADSAGGRAGATAPRPVPAADAVVSSPAPLAEPRHTANWSAVEGVYFRAATGVGVGGMVVIEYEPLILFRDGSSYEIDDAALEDVDLTEERIAKPRRFGRWTRSGNRFVLTGADGKPQDNTLQGGSFFKAYPADAGERAIARTYRRLSGGGNSAMGGDVMISVASRYAFRADGTYGRGGAVGAVNSGATSGAGSAMSRRGAPEGGRYALDHHTLTLIGEDGRSRRLFFAYGSRKDPPQPDRDMAFIGASVFSQPD